MILTIITLYFCMCIPKFYPKKLKKKPVAKLQRASSTKTNAERGFQWKIVLHFNLIKFFVHIF